LKQALLIIDAQHDLIEGSDTEAPVYEKERLVHNINAVIDKAKQAGALTVFVRDLDIAGGEGPGFEIHPGINIPSDASIINKSGTNSFYDTPLDGYLKSHNVKHLVIMGCSTPYCIDTAVRTATIKGYDVTLVGDGHSTADSNVLTAEQIIQHHNRILHGHDNVAHFSLVRNTSDDLFNPIHNNYR